MSILAWALKSSDGHYVVNSRNDTEEKTLMGVSPETRKMLKDRGYTVVQIKITEIKKEKTESDWCKTHSCENCPDSDTCVESSK